MSVADFVAALRPVASAAAWTAGTPPMDSMVLVGQMLAACVVFCWAAQVTTGEWSWVDRLWSIVPALYALAFAVLHADNARLCLMATLATIWGVRLTLNFARKDGFSGEEDYRWAIIRAWFRANDPSHPVGQEVFSFAFVALYQHVLIWSFVVPPCFVVLAAGSSPLGPLDFVLAGAFIAALVLETVVDEQQWAFQSTKHALTPAQRAALGGDYARGFCTTGAFAVSRHLNFFCEQSMWWVFYAFTVAAGAPLRNWAAYGAVALTLLFMGSTTMTEAVSASKYPAYRAYQRTTSAVIPWFRGVTLDSAAGQALVAQVTAGPVAPHKRVVAAPKDAAAPPTPKRRSASPRRAKLA